jgi:hypothetical protein
MHYLKGLLQKGKEQLRKWAIKKGAVRYSCTKFVSETAKFYVHVNARETCRLMKARMFVNCFLFRSYYWHNDILKTSLKNLAVAISLNYAWCFKFLSFNVSGILILLLLNPVLSTNNPLPFPVRPY